MNLTSELYAVTRYYKVVRAQKAVLAIAEDELRRRIAEYEEERLCLLVERVSDAGNGWCTLCHKIFPLDELYVTVSQNSLHTVCQTCRKGDYLLQKINGRLVAASTESTYDLGDVVEVGIMHRWSRRHMDPGIPPELAAEFIPEVPEIRLAPDDTLVIGGDPHFQSAE
jgi:hypothetical protein